MPLLDHQAALGRALRAPGPQGWTALTAETLRELTMGPGELAQLADLVGSRGFGFTRRVQRSWCRGRAAAVARLTLRSLPDEHRKKLVDDWVEAGGSASFDPLIEAEGFLDFLANRLADPSHALSVCRMERATYRASAAASRFTPPDAALLGDPDMLAQTGKGASLVRFFADPDPLFAAITHEAKAAWVFTSATLSVGEEFARFAINLSGQSLQDESFLGFVVDQLNSPIARRA